MRLEVIGQRVERGLDARRVVEIRRRRAERAEPGAAEPVLAEHPVQVAPADTAIGRDRALGPAVDPREGARAVGPVGRADMDLVAGKA